MTVKDCILSIPFDEMAVRLLAFSPRLRYSVAKCKEAYDIVGLMEPRVKEASELHVSLSSDADSGLRMEPGVGYDSDWDYDLMRKMVVAEGVDLRDLAMRLFFDLTYYGFSPDTLNHQLDMDEFAETEPNKYDLKQAKDREEQKYLRGMSRRINVMRLMTDDTTLSLEEMSPFENSYAAYHADFTSRCQDVMARVDYIEELYTRYFKLPDDDTDFDRVFLMAKTSSEFPLNDVDQKALNRLLALFGKREVTLGYGTDDTLGREIRIDMAFTWPERPQTKEV